jgi:hypothetical protein
MLENNVGYYTTMTIAEMEQNGFDVFVFADTKQRADYRSEMESKYALQAEETMESVLLGNGIHRLYAVLGIRLNQEAPVPKR